MASLKKYSDKEWSEAKKAGFRRKKPKKPKASASLTVLNNYVTRWNKYVDDVKKAAKKYRTKEAEKKKRDSLKEKIRGHR